jgi:hypothetical protein
MVEPLVNPLLLSFIKARGKSISWLAYVSGGYFSLLYYYYKQRRCHYRRLWEAINEKLNEGIKKQSIHYYFVTISR